MKLLGKEIRTKDGKMLDSIIQIIKTYWLAKQIRKGKLPRGRSRKEVIAAITDSYTGIMGEIWGVLSVRIYRGETGEWEDGGCISIKKVTTAFRDRIVASLQNSTTSPLDVFKYHACGTGTTAEANTQTALVTEVGSRVSGTQATDGNANVYRTVATITPGNTYAITEHGILSAASAGVLMDRSVFAAINVGASDSIQFTYDCTFNAES